MSNEIRVSVSLTAQKGPLEFDRRHTQAFDHPSVKGPNPGLVTFTTSEKDVDFGDIDCGRVQIINTSTANSFQYGPKDTTMKNLTTMPPKDVNLITKTTGVVLRGRSLSGTCSVQILGLSATT